MDRERIFYFDGKSARAAEVRVLIFNGMFNIYHDETNEFIVSYPVKGSNVSKTADQYFIYFEKSGTYLQLAATHSSADSFVKDIIQTNDSWINKLVRQRIVLLFVLMVALIVGVYFLLVTLIPVIGATMISKDVEIRMGDQLKAVMMQEEAVIGAKIDSLGTKKLQAFADKVELSQTYPIRLTLVRSNVVNAYALPGGQVVVYSGMLKKIPDAETLVALLAHEASHVNQRHTLRSLLKSAANGMIISIIFNDVSGVTAALVSHAETLRGLEYSRSIETEADDSGMKLMVRNNVNASGMKRLMEILKKEGDVPENFSFLSSHPLTKKRIEAADAFIRKTPQQESISPELAAAFNHLKEE
jgi:predicted Zn-dependent protease